MSNCMIESTHVFLHQWSYNVAAMGVLWVVQHMVAAVAVTLVTYTYIAPQQVSSIH